VGAALIGVLVNGLVLNNVSSYTQQVVIGLILIAAVAFDRWLKARTGGEPPRCAPRLITG